MDLKNKLENIILPGIGVLLGGIVGTIDVLTTGLPFLSGYLELTSLTTFDFTHKAFDVRWKTAIIGNLSYLVGVVIPFGIKYSEGIYGFVEEVLK